MWRPKQFSPCRLSCGDSNPPSTLLTLCKSDSFWARQGARQCLYLSFSSGGGVLHFYTEELFVFPIAVGQRSVYGKGPRLRLHFMLSELRHWYQTKLFLTSFWWCGISYSSSFRLRLKNFLSRVKLYLIWPVGNVADVGSVFLGLPDPSIIKQK